MDILTVESTGTTRITNTSPKPNVGRLYLRDEDSHDLSIHAWFDPFTDGHRATKLGDLED